VRRRQPGKRGHCRAIIRQRIGHGFMVEAFAPVRFDPALAKADAFRDDDAGAGRGFIVGEIAGRHADRKIGHAAERGEARFPLHFRPLPVAPRIREISGEFDEQIAVQARFVPCIVDGEEQFVPGAAARTLFVRDDARHTVAG